MKMRKHRVNKLRAVGTHILADMLSDYLDYTLYDITETSMVYIHNFFESKYRNTRFAKIFSKKSNNENRGVTEQ